MSGLSNTNYAITYAAGAARGEFTITARPVTVKATNATKVYGNPNPTFGIAVAGGSLAPSESLTVLGTPSFAFDPSPAVDVGSYRIVVSGLSNANYAITYATGDDRGLFTITVRPITVTADSKTKLLGAADPALTYQVTSGSLVAGDGFTGSIVRDPGETIGTYAIRQGTLSAGTNYTLTFVNGTLKILYRWDGFRQPINDTAHQTGLLQSKFRLGQTIPAKFLLKNAAGAVVQQTGNPAFSRSQNLGACDSSTQPEIEEVVPPDGGTAFVWDGSQYHYNWSTKGLTAGEYRIYANLADGTKPYVDICLTK